MKVECACVTKGVKVQLAPGCLCDVDALHMHTKASGHAGVIEEEAQCTFSPHINPASEQLLEDSLQVPANFYERQRFFYEMRQERMQRLQADAVSLLSCACPKPLHF